jgi:uncharacterized protein (TIGR02172 family)
MIIKQIDLKDYKLSGGGKLGESYIMNSNPDILLKLYPLPLKQMGLDEYDRAWKVYKMGLPCPEPGELVSTADGRIGIQFQRIMGKKSFARAISENPEKVEQYAAEFAQTCKKLHALEPKPGLFPNAKDQYIQGISLNPYLTDQERTALERFIRDLPDANTAVHGDLHHGNVIFTESGQQYFIDLSEFCTGSPLFDIGVIMLQTLIIPEEMMQDLYHIGKELSKVFWEAFVKAYFGPNTPVEQIERMAAPYAFLRILVVEPMLGHQVQRIRPALHAMIGIKD